jgi:hypothetical protein
VIGHIKPWDPQDPTQGLFVYGWFEETLYAIEEIPFEIPGSGKPLLGCDSTGMAIFEIGGEAFELEPGGGWSTQAVHDRGGGCYETYTISIANAGLLESTRLISDLSARDDRVQLEMVTTDFSQDEEISFDIVVSGEDNIDFSHFCPFTFEMRDGENWIEVGSCSNLPDYVPEPFPRLPGDLIEISLPLSTIGLSYPYQYELGVAEYRVRFTYASGNEVHALYSHKIRVVP